MKGTILDVNPFLVSIAECDQELLIGRKPWDLGLFQDPEAAKRMFDTLMDSGRTQRSHITLKSSDGRLIESEAVANVFSAGDERTVQYNFRTDGIIDEPQKSIAPTAAPHSLQEKTPFDATNSVIAHDFNNVLGMILLSAEGIASSSELKTKTALYAERIIEAVKRGTGIVKRLSLFPRTPKPPKHENIL
jgi:hypothetical protein